MVNKTSFAVQYWIRFEDILRRIQSKIPRKRKQSGLFISLCFSITINREILLFAPACEFLTLPGSDQTLLWSKTLQSFKCLPPTSKYCHGKENACACACKQMQKTPKRTLFTDIWLNTNKLLSTSLTTSIKHFKLQDYWEARSFIQQSSCSKFTSLSRMVITGMYLLKCLPQMGERTLPMPSFSLDWIFTAAS